MRIFLNIVIYVLVITAVLQGWFIVAIPLAIWFTLRVSAVWLLPPMFLIDGYFGAFYSLPVLFLVTLAWFAVSELLRPYLLWHNEEEL